MTLQYVFRGGVCGLQHAGVEPSETNLLVTEPLFVPPRLQVTAATAATASLLHSPFLFYDDFCCTLRQEDFNEVVFESMKFQSCAKVHSSWAALKGVSVDADHPPAALAGCGLVSLPLPFLACTDLQFRIDVTAFTIHRHHLHCLCGAAGHLCRCWIPGFRSHTSLLCFWIGLWWPVSSGENLPRSPSSLTSRARSKVVPLFF